MAKVKIEIQPLTIQVDGPLALSTGFRRGLIHRTVEQDVDGFAYIPASSLKGRVRRACEQLATQAGLHVCRAPRPSGMCSVHTQVCLACRVFGMPGRGSDLRWRDAQLAGDYRAAFDDDNDDDNYREAQFYARTQVQLSRVLGTAAPDRLFTSEFTVENLRFESSITGWLEITPIAGDDSAGGYELLLLLAGLRLVNTIGGGASRGTGWLSLDLPEKVTVNDAKVRWQDVLENLDLLCEFGKEVGRGE
jgi:CRISPR/Cas system CSM-associated protein Csm3 (group 7 of RAMP superfamily)